jgi:glycerol-3-phosphate cytidylyltransferase
VILLKRIITYGSFDLLHYGHINLLRRAKVLGDYLIVGLATNEFNIIKGKEAFFSYEERKLLLEAIRYVDLVIPSERWEQREGDIKKYKVDLFVMGDDWVGNFDYLKSCCEVVYLPRTPEISTTTIKTYLEIAKTDNDCKNIF